MADKMTVTSVMAGARLGGDFDLPEYKRRRGWLPARNSALPPGGDDHANLPTENATQGRLLKSHFSDARVGVEFLHVSRPRRGISVRCAANARTSKTLGALLRQESAPYCSWPRRDRLRMGLCLTSVEPSDASRSLRSDASRLPD